MVGDKTTFLPEVIFELAPTDMEAELFYSFSLPKRKRWHKVLYRAYPELKDILESSKQKEEKLEQLRLFAEENVKKNEEKILLAKNEIKEEWSNISSDFLKTLAEHFETDWPEDKPIIKGYISIQPVYPRFLDTYSFCVGYWDPKKAREVIAHEILHFLWFKKWKEVFPKSERKEFESPYLAWRLSEVIDPVILQCHPKLAQLIRPVKWGYDSFKEITIDGTEMSQYFAKEYKDCISAGYSFEQTMHKLWEEAQKHRDALERF